MVGVTGVIVTDLVAFVWGRGGVAGRCGGVPPRRVFGVSGGSGLGAPGSGVRDKSVVPCGNGSKEVSVVICESVVLEVVLEVVHEAVSLVVSEHVVPEDARFNVGPGVD